MSKLKCPKCRSEYLGVRTDNYCLSCGWNNYTVFHEITASPEVLAEEFVEMMYDRVAGDYRYYSMLTGEFYNSREEAIAATVAKLMEVCDATD